MFSHYIQELIEKSRSKRMWKTQLNLPKFRLPKYNIRKFYGSEGYGNCTNIWASPLCPWAVKSVQNQRIKDIEICIICDGSPESMVTFFKKTAQEDPD